MLATLGTYLARATRSRRPLLVVSVEQYASAQAAVSAAHAAKVPLALVVDDVALIRPILALAGETSSPVIVLGRCADEKSAATLCALGIGGVVLVVTGEPNLKVIAAVTKRAAAAGVVVATEFETPPTDPIHVVGGGAAIAFMADTAWMKKPSSFLDLKSSLRLPVAMAIDGLSPRAVRGLLKAGLDVVWIRTGIEEAYLGGLRTALRNRNAVRAHHYLPYAQAAVAGAVKGAVEAYIKES